MLNRFVCYWVYGGALASVVLFLLIPVLAKTWTPLMVATYLHLPVYMLHQLEEHDRDRFRTFFNETIGEGYEALTSLAVFLTNVPGVWLVVTAAILATGLIHTGWSLIAVYLVLVNAVVHIAHAILFKRYNPGLITAVILFLPLGVFSLRLADQTGSAQVTHHVVAAVMAVGIHAAILIHVRRRLQVLKLRAAPVVR